MLPPNKIAGAYLASGVAKAGLPAGKLFLSACFAGVFIALACVGFGVAGITAANPALARLIGACAFPVGLAMVIFTGSELFTGNCLMIIPTLERQISWGRLMRSWGLSYIGNLAGAVLTAAMMAASRQYSMFGNALGGAVIDVAVSKVTLSFSDAFVRGIVCNMLVCTAIWMAFAASGAAGKIAALYLPIMLFVLCGLEHSIANMYFIPAGIFAASNPEWLAAAGPGAEGLTWGAFFLRNLLPVTLGNILGGAGVMGVGFWFLGLDGQGAKRRGSSDGVTDGVTDGASDRTPVKSEGR